MGSRFGILEGLRKGNGGIVGGLGKRFQGLTGGGKFLGYLEGNGRLRKEKGRIYLFLKGLFKEIPNGPGRNLGPQFWAPLPYLGTPFFHQGAAFGAPRIERLNF